jgi:DNA-binding transcriptional ArsR family regulator
VTASPGASPGAALGAALDESLDVVFRALGDPTRRAMLRLLAAGDKSIGELAEPFSMSFAGAAKHVTVLEGAGLLTKSVQGRDRVCRLEPAPLAEADAWLRYYARFWTDRIDALESRLRAEAGK